VYWLGHLGITAGLAFTSQKVFARPVPEAEAKQSAWMPDFRIIFIGVLTPDLIDKPIAYLFFDTTRLFAHSLFFYLLILMIGSVLFKRARPGVLMFVAAALIHLIEDQMWKQSKVLFWPFTGIGFSPTEQQGVGERVSSLLSQNYLLVPEIVGGTILIALMWRITTQKSWSKFFNTGKVD